MKIFETVSFHIVKPCDFSCKFCYPTFNDFKVNKQLSIFECILILDKLKEAGVKKVTFAGGEPMLYRYINDAIRYTKSIGLTTSIISNGSMITDMWLQAMRPYLDWVGISIDSLNAETNTKIGRRRADRDFDIDYPTMIENIKRLGYKLKINTVVNRYNEDEDMQKFIEWSGPDRWKIFDTLKVIGQNDEQFEEIRSSEGAFKRFVDRHYSPNMVVEDNEAMTGSYLLVDPLGRFFEDSKGTHTYSDSLTTHNIDHCLKQLNLNREMFIKRGGIYNW